MSDFSDFKKTLTRPDPRSEIVKRKRNTTIEPWMIPVFSRAMSQGHTIATAADLIDVTPGRVSKWLKEAESDECQDDLLLEFSAAAKKSRSEVVGELVDLLRIHAVKSDRACLELLKILHPDFNVAKRVDAQVAVTAPPKMDLSTLTDEELQAYQALERKALGAGSSNG